MSDTVEPSSVTAGDRIRWTLTLADYPASAGWVLSYALINAAAKIEFAASASGDDHAVDVSAATSAGWAAGDYTFQAYVTRSSDRYRVRTGTLKVEPNFAALTTFDGRSTARQALDAVEAVIKGRASQAQQEYAIGNRQLKFMPVADLILLRDKLRIDVQREDNADRISKGLAPRGRIVTRG